MLAIGTEVFDIRSKISAKLGLKRFLSGQIISNLFNSYPNSFKSRPVKPIKSKLIDETNDSKYLT